MAVQNVKNQAVSADTPDVADRIILPRTGDNPYKEAYAESNPNRVKTIDPFEKPELNIYNQDGYLGTDPIYQNYASIGGRPLNGEDKLGRFKASDGSVPDLEDVVVNESAPEEDTGSGSNPNSDNSNAETKLTTGTPTVVPPIPTSK